jgi:hypothetical protein
VSIRSLVRAWNQFFFAPQSPVSISLYRILFGLLIIADLLLLRPDWLAWYGTQGWVSINTMHTMEPGVRLNLFTLIPQSNAWIEALFWVFLASAALLTIGFLTRVNSVIVFLCLTSIHQRDLYILHPGDALLRVTGFFLMFAPAGAALSIDRLVRIRRGKEGREIRPRSPWAQRMIQIEVALLYVVGFWWKSMGTDWADGTALHYVLHLDEFRRFPLPSWFQGPLMVKLGTWFTLVLEFSLGVLVWFKELRYSVLLLGILFHLFLEYALNIQLFQWIILATYVTFVDPSDWARIWNWIRRQRGFRGRDGASELSSARPAE